MTTRQVEQLTVHLPCGRIRGMTASGRQGCPCAPAEPWSGRDVSRAVDLCQVCARGTAGGVTRWSWHGCTTCRCVEDALQAWLGVRVLPLGRHSIMNGVAGRVTADATGGADSFLQSLNALNLSWSRLSQWADAETRRLAARGGFVEEDVPLSVWQRTFATSVAASGDAYERLLQIKIPAGVLAP